MTAKFIIFLIISLAAMALAHAASISSTHNSRLPESLLGLARRKRQIDITMSVERDDETDETNAILSAIARLYQSESGKTTVNGEAEFRHSSNSLQAGSTRYSGKIHIHHDYRRR